MKKRISLTEIILVAIENGLVQTIDLIDTISRPAPEAMRKMYARGIQGGRYDLYPLPKIGIVDSYRESQKLYTRLSQLKKDGLLEKSGDKWKLTDLGQFRLNKIKSKNWMVQKTKSQNPIIISYDIPVKLNKERFWLREILKLFDFQPIHKSVWLGSYILPEKFYRELHNRKIIECVHVFQIGKKGTLKQLN